MLKKFVDKKVHFPLILTVGPNEFILNDIPVKGKKFLDIMQLAKKEKELALAFFSSQPPFVFERIHAICDTFIPDVSQKIDTLLREIVKNGEKENITLIAKKLGLIKEDAECAPLSLMRQILNEEYCLKGENTPLLYKYPEIHVIVHMQVKENELHIEIENYGHIQKQTQSMIQKRIEAGQAIAQFDLRQEFEMKNFSDCSDTILKIFLQDYHQKEFKKLWNNAVKENFEDYWNLSLYFMMIVNGVHSSFYPYFALAYSQLRAELKREKDPGEKHFSAGMGYIQCAFVIEANRSLYGTYGKIFTPRNQGDWTMAGFKIGLPKIDVEI